MSGNQREDPVSNIRGQRFEIMAENFDDVFWMFDADFSEILYVNDQVERIYGIAPSSLENDPMNFLEAIHPEDRDSVEEALEKLSNGERVNIEYRVNLKTDYSIWVDVHGIPVLDEEDDVDVLIGSSREITHRKKAEEELRREKNRMQTMVKLQNQVNQAGWDLNRIFAIVTNRLLDLTDADGVSVELEEDGALISREAQGILVNQVGSSRSIDDSLSGRTYQNGETKRYDSLQDEPDLNSSEGPIGAILLKPLEYSGDRFGVLKIVYEEPEGIDTGAESLLELIAGILSASISRAFQYRQKEEYLDQVLEMARTDALTGLDNRRRFGEHLERELERSRRYSHPLCFTILDLDHFKKINDQYGHLKGDDVLKNVARILRNETRETDETGRFGGEEFSVLLPETSDEDGVDLIQRLLNQIREFRFNVDGEQFNVTASAGIAEFEDGDTEDDLIRRADEALYRAKSMGRDCIKTA